MLLHAGANAAHVGRAGATALHAAAGVDAVGDAKSASIVKRLLEVGCWMRGRGEVKAKARRGEGKLSTFVFCPALELWFFLTPPTSEKTGYLSPWDALPYSCRPGQTLMLRTNWG